MKLPPGLRTAVRSGIFLVAVCATFASLPSCVERNDLVQVLRSPQQSYVLTIRGRAGTPLYPGDERVLTVDGMKNDRVVFRDVLLYEADYLDSSFAARYPEVLWPRENVVRFKSERRRAEGCDELHVRNSGVEPLSHLTVRARDMFLILDLAAADELSVAVTPFVDGEAGWVITEGRFAGGPELPQTLADSFMAKRQVKLRYSVDVLPGGLSVAVTELDPDYVIEDCH